MPLKSNVRPHRKLHMKAGLPFATLLALSREVQAAAGASSSAYRTKVVRSAWAVRPSAASARSNRLEGKKKLHSALPSVCCVPSKHRSSSQFRRINSAGLAPCRRAKRQDQHKHQSGSLRALRWYASPFKCKARLRLRERGLTIPSSGPAYGGPLKSNVRRPREMPIRTRQQFKLRPHDPEGVWESNDGRYRTYAHQILAEHVSLCDEVLKKWPIDAGAAITDPHAYPEISELGRRRDQTADTVRIYAAMAVEGYLNFYGVLRLGQDVFDEHFERLGLVPKLRALLLTCDQLDIPNV